jgi:cytidine deaminase
MTDLDAMIKAARAVRERAYAPYSNFRVGACLESEGGKLYVGCNVESAAYPQGQCAEAAAISAMIAGGDQRIRAIVVMGGGEELCSPCGGCRQRLVEFAKPATPVHICGPEGLRQTVTLGELLPLAFGPHNLLDEGPDDDEDED